MHPDQDAEHPWLPDETDFLRAALEARVPLLGVCLGVQLIARAAGASVGPAEAPEVGWHEVELTDAGRDDPVSARSRRASRRSSGTTTPSSCRRRDAARQRARPRTQAYRIGDHAWGVQFHAEVTRAMIETWLVEGERELPKPRRELRGGDRPR